MKKITALLLVIMLMLSGCSSVQTEAVEVQVEEVNEIIISEQNAEEVDATEDQFTSLNDPKLMEYMEKTIYQDVVAALTDDDYVVENVSSTYISKEYIEELSYNSQENVYFGYTLSELELQFQEEKYVFTCNNTGETIIAPYEEYDETYEQVIKDVAIGSGVILLCVTVSVASGGIGAPAVSAIFAMSAKTATTMALSSSVISGTFVAAITGYQTKNVEQTIKSASLAAGDGFKWGALTGMLVGGTGTISALRGATVNGLTMNEVAMIQKESKYSIDIIKQFHSVDEYKIYRDAKLYTKKIGGKTALIREIDMDYVSEMADGTQVTNLERMRNGYSPLDALTGKPYQLHHIGQKSDGALSILTESEHQGNASILNIAGKSSEIDRNAFSQVRKDFWKSFSECY